ncbi:patatin-like phospholipase family protein [Curtobacterium sp. 24E2]
MPRSRGDRRAGRPRPPRPRRPAGHRRTVRRRARGDLRRNPAVHRLACQAARDHRGRRHRRHVPAADRSRRRPAPRAVAASCSVPFVWSPVGIEGRPYVDGGVRSGTNADAAAGHERVLVIACGPEGPSPVGPWLDVAVESLRAGGSSVEVVVADSTAQEAFGTNSLSLATQAPSAEAGRAQGTAVAEQIAAFWADDLVSVVA